MIPSTGGSQSLNNANIAKEAAAAGQQQQPAADTMDIITVPVQVPHSLLVKNPTTGETPVDNYEVKLIHKDMVITTKDDLRQYAQEIRNDTLPAGMKVDVADSRAGMKVEMGKGMLTGIAQLGGAVGMQSMIWHGSWMSVPLAVAAPMAMIGGTIGVVTSVGALKKALDMKNYYEGMKSRGVTEIPTQVPVRTGKGIEMQVRNVSVDQMISGARDQAVLGIGQTISNSLMVAAGATMFAPLAVAALATGIGTALYASRHQFAALGARLWEFICKPFHHKSAEAAKVEAPAASPAAVAATPPVQTEAAKTPTPAPAAPAQAAPAAEPLPSKDQLRQIWAANFKEPYPSADQAAQTVARMQPDLQKRLTELQALKPQVEKDPSIAERPEVKQKAAEFDGMMQQFQLFRAIALVEGQSAPATAQA